MENMDTGKIERQFGSLRGENQEQVALHHREQEIKSQLFHRGLRQSTGFASSCSYLVGSPVSRQCPNDLLAKSMQKS